MSSGLEEVVTVCLPHSAQARSSRATSALQLFLLGYFVTMAKLRNTNFTFVIYLFSVFMYVYACVCTCMFAYVCNMCRLGAPSGTVSIALHLTLETASLSLNLELFQIDPRPTSTGGAWLCLGFNVGAGI